MTPELPGGDKSSREEHCGIIQGSKNKYWLKPTRNTEMMLLLSFRRAAEPSERNNEEKSTKEQLYKTKLYLRPI